MQIGRDQIPDIGKDKRELETFCELKDKYYGDL